MASLISDLYIRLGALTAPYTKALIEAGDEGEAFAEGEKVRAESMRAANEESAGSFGVIGKAALGIGAALVGVSAISIKWATSFQAQMESIHTQAGVSQSQIASLSNGVLALAGQVGFSPDSLAEALYHIESSFASVGITGPKALDLLRIAAEGAAVGHANLVDVTNALDAAVASGIPGVQNFSQAMGTLNATVGAGDMTMQDLANAFSTGLLANVKSYGLSITDVGAALATFGDNNIRGQNAATDLRMAVQALAVPAKGAASDLAKMGLKADDLAKVMSQHGLLPALQLLHDRMTKIGVTAKDQGQVLTELFGKKAGAGIVVLYDQLDRLKSKYPDLTKGANGFGDAWTQTKKTIRQQLNEIGAGVQAAGIKFGQILLPLVSRGLNDVTGLVGREAPKVGRGLSALWAGFTGKAAAKGSSPTDLGLDRLGGALRSITNDVLAFGKDVVATFRNLVSAAGPTVAVIGVTLLGALKVIGEILAHVVGPALKGFSDWLKNNKTLVTLFATVVLGGLATKLMVLKGIKAATGITDLATSILKFPKTAVSGIGAAADGLKKSWASLKDAGKIFDGVRLRAMYAMDGIKSGMSSLGSALSSGAGKAAETIGGKLKTAAQAASDLGAKGLEAAKSLGATAWGAATDAANGIGTALAAGGKAALEFGRSAAIATAGALKQAGAFVLEKVAALASAVAEGAATAAQWLLNLAMEASPIVWIATAIIGLVAVFVILWVKCAWFRDFWKGLWRDVVAAAKLAWSILWGDVFKPVVDFYQTVAVGALHALESAWKAVWSGLTSAAKAAWNLLWNDDFKPLVDVYKTTIVGALHTAESAWKAVWSALTSAASASWSWLNSNIFSPLTNFFNKVIGGAISAGKSAWDTAWSGIQTTVQDVWSVVKPIFDAISSAAKGVGSAISGVAHAAGAVGGAIGTAAHYANPLNWFDQGGFVPGVKNAPMLAVVHGGEYVVSNDMQAGRAPIDSRAYAGTLSYTGAAGGAGSSGGAGGGNVYVIINNAGSLVAQQSMIADIQRGVLQVNSRNRNNGLAYARG